MMDAPWACMIVYGDAPPVQFGGGVAVMARPKYGPNGRRPPLESMATKFTPRMPLGMLRTKLAVPSNATSVMTSQPGDGRTASTDQYGVFVRKLQFSSMSSLSLMEVTGT